MTATPDLGRMFDLNGGDSQFHEPAQELKQSKLTRGMVDRMEECLRAADEARDDLKAVAEECAGAGFGPLDIQAMKKIAKLRLRDKKSDARDQLQSLRRIGRLVGFDLFDWAEALAPGGE